MIKNADAKVPPLKSQWIWTPQEFSISKQVWETLPWGNLKAHRPTGSGLVSEVQPWAKESSLLNS